MNKQWLQIQQVKKGVRVTQPEKVTVKMSASGVTQLVMPGVRQVGGRILIR